jgi:hypothetical protein
LRKLSDVRDVVDVLEARLGGRVVKVGLVREETADIALLRSGEGVKGVGVPLRKEKKRETEEEKSVSLHSRDSTEDESDEGISEEGDAPWRSSKPGKSCRSERRAHHGRQSRGEQR